jgi:2-polyprenyl-6-methoxyphenol hydroxylase-like FAD-dependent oxidoreductase
MPQWDFLNFLVEVGSRCRGFHVRMSAEATDLIENRGAVIGLRAETTTGPLDVHAPLVVGADGRRSIVRKRAGLSVEEFGAPMDVL